MIVWLAENTELLLFAQGILVSAGIYHLAVGRRNGRRRPQRNKKTHDIEVVFEKLADTSKLRLLEVSQGFVGTRIKATGSLVRIKKLNNDLVALSIIPQGIGGVVSTGVPFSEYEEIAQPKSGQDITLEGDISYMDLDHTHELFLSDCKLST